MAYLSQIRAGGKQYIYLTIYVGYQAYSSKTEKHIYSFGNSHVALVKMKRWLRNFEQEFPKELKEMGFTELDLRSWIKTLETGITKTGRIFKVDMEKGVAN